MQILERKSLSFWTIVRLAYFGGRASLGIACVRKDIYRKLCHLALNQLALGLLTLGHLELSPNTKENTLSHLFQNFGLCMVFGAK